MSIQLQSYSPFNNYFGLADLINNSTPSIQQSTTVPLSSLNPLAASFVPTSHQISEPQEEETVTESSEGSAPPSPLSLPNLPNSIRYKLEVQRQRSALNSEQYSRVRFCVFCQKSNQPLSLQRSHRLRDASGRVVCPFLRQTVCPQCGATGDDAHTLKYCPANQPTLIFT